MDSSNLCTICLDTLDIVEVKKLSCSHEFHEVCIQEWVQQSVTCPICRADVTDDFPMKLGNDSFVTPHTVLPNSERITIRESMIQRSTYIDISPNYTIRSEVAIPISNRKKLGIFAEVITIILIFASFGLVMFTQLDLLYEIAKFLNNLEKSGVGNFTNGNITEFNMTDFNMTVSNITDFNVTDFNVTDFNVTDFNVNLTNTSIHHENPPSGKFNVIVTGIYCMIIFFLSACSICSRADQKNIGVSYYMIQGVASVFMIFTLGYYFLKIEDGFTGGFKYPTIKEYGNINDLSYKYRLYTGLCVLSVGLLIFKGMIESTKVVSKCFSRQCWCWCCSCIRG
jgi:hypothetical protein